jgi:hypothetical protein
LLLWFREGAELSYYSGKFFRQKDHWVYVRRPSFLHETKELKMVYSSSNRAWVIKWAHDHDEGSYLVKSSETDTFDIMSVADEKWYANLQAGDIPMDFLALACADCNTDSCSPDHGLCQDNVCVCYEGQTGLNCELHIPKCQYYAVDYRTKAGLPDRRGGAFFLDAEFTPNALEVGVDDTMQNVTIFDRPIYYHSLVKAVVVFSGRRWIMFGPEENIEGYENPCKCIFDGLAIDDSMTSLAAMRALQNHTKFIPLYFSSPMDYGTPTQGVDFRTLTWFSASKEVQDESRAAEVIMGFESSILGFAPDLESPMSAKFLCSECYENNDCQNYGICSRDWGICQCQLFYR